MVPAAYGPHKTLYNWFVRWSRNGYLRPNLRHLAAEGGPPDGVMIDSTHIKAHRTAASLLKIHPVSLAARKAGELQAARGLHGAWPASYLSSVCILHDPEAAVAGQWI